MAVQMLNAGEVLAIHERVARDFAETGDPIGDAGTREDGHLLESAVSRQYVGFDGVFKHPNPYSNAATLTFGLCCNHPFHNGNKRTALVSMLAHLDKNGLTVFGVKQRELYTMIKAVATHKLGVRDDPRRRRRNQEYSRREADTEVAEIELWLRKRARKVQGGERQITYRQLKQILKRCGYTLEHHKGNKVGVYREVEVRRGLRRTKRIEKKHIGAIGYPGDGKVVGINAIKQARRLCKVDEASGYDSASFYDGADVIETFINEYRGILAKLARE
jgi:death-on-curing protein